MKFFPCFKLGGTAIALVELNSFMKKMLITASMLGAAIAGLVLYSQRKNKTQNKIADAADDAYQTMNKALGEVERPAHHAMG